jgi:low affinity Fe/Cu permease
MIKTGPPPRALDYDKQEPREGHNIRSLFRRFSSAIASAVGSPWAFAAACAAIIIWAIMGPHYHYSDTWQLVINTGTTIVTFLMVFLIQNTQNRDAKAIHLKLDELIRGVKGARTHLVDLENMSDEELEKLQSEFQRVREKASRRKEQKQGGNNGAPENALPAGGASREHRT